MSIDGIKYDTLIFREKNGLTCYLYLLSFEINLRKYCGFFCGSACTPKQPWHFQQVVLSQGLAKGWIALSLYKYCSLFLRYDFGVTHIKRKTFIFFFASWYRQ
jgi:hypothetical protein